MPDDAELLQQYLRDHSDAAFAELVRRHIDLVYSAALRKLNGDTHRAKDVTQAVFIQLATQRPPPRERMLGGWLYTAAHYLACKVVRTEVRRRRREQEAHAMHEMNAPGAHLDWERVRPVLDDAIHDLAGTDREAVVLRFFEKRAFAEIGARLGLSEDAARMRVDRALDKLHAGLTRRGIRSTGGALAVLLAEQAMASAPLEIAASVTQAALTAGASATLATVGFMSTAKSVSLAAAIGVSLVANVLLVIGLTDRGAAALHAAAHRLATSLGLGASARDPAALASGSATARPAATPAGVGAAAGAHIGPGPAGANADSSVFKELLSDDPATFAANLLAAGFSRGATRGAVMALLRSHDNRARAALFKASPLPPYWMTTASTAPTPEQLALFGRTQAERMRVMRELFPEERDKQLATLRATYGALPDEKLQRLDDLEADYKLRRQQMLAGRSGPILPWDRDPIAQLDAAKQRDLQDLLTPAEREEYNFRTSNIATEIRQLPEFNPTEAEFRALFAARSAFEERTRLAAASATPQQIMQAQQELNAQLLSALGAERFAAYERASDRGFQEAYVVAQQLNLPTTNAAAVYDLQRETLARAAAIRANPDQTPDQRAAQLRELAATTEERFAALLTPAGREAYKRTGGAWLRNLDRPAPPPTR